jgi:hypothetical protein
MSWAVNKTHWPPAVLLCAALGADTAEAVVIATATCRPQWLPMAAHRPAAGIAHIILAVTDEGSPRLTTYRRIILNVKASGADPLVRSRRPRRLDRVLAERRVQGDPRGPGGPPHYEQSEVGR